jgi:hypothetical protein
MVYVRRELGSRVRLKRIPEFHVRLDESAERGTRVLRLLDDLEEGRTPSDAPRGESLPTPVARIPRPGDVPADPDAAAEPRRRPRRHATPRRTAAGGDGSRTRTPRRGRT